MKYREFKGTKISEIGLGTWQFSGTDWGDISKETAFDILQSFVNNEGNFIDTADVYGDGRSERLIGEFIKNQPIKPYIASKIGRRGDNGYGIPQNLDYDIMRKQIEDSLNNLGVSTLFLEQLHCIPFDFLKKGEVFDHLRKFKQEKLIEHWGVSVETVEQALLCIEQEDISSIQIIFNLFRQHVAEELFEKAAEKNIAIIVRLPLASGLLCKKFNTNTIFAENDHRNYNAEGAQFNIGETFSGIDFQQGLIFADQMYKILNPYNMAQSAIRWILDHPEVTTVIPGASSPNQVITNLQSSKIPNVSKKSKRILRNYYESTIRATISGEI